MRDTIKDEKYFNSILIKEAQSVILFENAVKNAILEKGETDRGTRNGYNILINSYDKQINVLYSIGEKIEDIKDSYKKLLSYYSKMWDRKYGYIGLIKILSLAVLFDIEKDEIRELEDKIINEEFDDYLVNVLIKSIDTGWSMNGDGFEFDIYGYLKTIIEGEKTTICETLREYLQKKWYEIHHECAWYDSHKSNKDVYYGYWSFEAGAIAKILNIDDSSLKDEPYYPYDLVHFKDEGDDL